MGIKFTLHATPKPKGRKGETLTHARALCQGTYKLEKVCRLICERSSVSSADVKSVLDSLAWVIEDALSDGCHVELDDLGYFAPSLRTEPSKTNADKNSVKIDGVNYRCSTQLKKKLADIDLEYIKAKKKPNGEDERKKRMLQHLAGWGSISPRNYAEVNVCSRYRAEIDLKKFVEEGLLVRVGHHNKVLYLLAEES